MEEEKEKGGYEKEKGQMGDENWSRRKMKQKEQERVI